MFQKPRIESKDCKRKADSMDEMRPKKAKTEVKTIINDIISRHKLFKDGDQKFCNLIWKS